MTAHNGNTEQDERGLLPYPVIIAATKGDPEAMKIVVQHYESYIASLSMRKLIDERGNTYYGINGSEENELPLCMENKVRVPIHLKLTLTIKEAAEYSNIGINKIDTLLKQPNCPFVLFVGIRKLVKRREFEEYIRRELII